MQLDSPRHFGTCGSEIILEQLEERIVLDAGIDDVSCRVDVFGSQAVDQLDSGDFADDAAGAAEAGLEAPLLAVETGSETLPDGTWHYWQRDWAVNGNGYEFHAWQDGSSSFHQIQWDTATNSKGTHNGFDYNLQRNGSWSYQAVQWDASQNGYSYNATSAGAYSYEAHQWSNGMGHDYASDSNGTWTYRAIQPGQAAGDKVEYASDWKGYWNYTYTWANGVNWTDGSRNYSFKVASGFNNPESLINVNGTLYFVAGDDTHGYELWKSDGTASGTALVKDIRPGDESSDPVHLTDVNGILYFVADDGAHGWELWKSDGTAGGTVMVKDIAPGTTTAWGVTSTNSSHPKELTNLNGTLYFSALDGSHGIELWKTNGTASDTVMVKDINPVGHSVPEELTNVNGTLYFRAVDSTHHTELWKSDGTAGGTTLVKDIWPGWMNAGWPDHLASVNGTLYFAANGSPANTELWKSDGTAAGTVLVKDINPSGSSQPEYLTNFNGILYFTADDGMHGWELWKSDGTAAGTQMVKDILSGQLSGGPRLLNEPRSFLEMNGVLYFEGRDSHGYELWRSDGTTLGTYMVKDIWEGLDGGGQGDSWPRHLTSVNGMLYFKAFGDGGWGLWRSDGSAAGTVNVKKGASELEDLVDVDGTLYFTTYSSVSGSHALWAVRVASS